MLNCNHEISLLFSQLPRDGGEEGDGEQWNSGGRSYLSSQLILGVRLHISPVFTGEIVDEAEKFIL